MYPDEEERPEFRPLTAVSIDLMSDRAIDDDLALEEAEEFTKNHPLSRQMYANIAFEDVRFVFLYFHIFKIFNCTFCLNILYNTQ